MGKRGHLQGPGVAQQSSAGGSGGGGRGRGGGGGRGAGRGRQQGKASKDDAANAKPKFCSLCSRSDQECAVTIDDSQTWGCKECRNYLEDTFPGWEFGEFHAMLKDDTSVLNQLAERFDPAYDSRNPPLLSSKELQNCGIELSSKFAALTKSDIEKEFGRSPASLKLKSIYVPGKNGNMMQLFPVRPPNKAFACRYASLKVFHTATQEVQTDYHQKPVKLPFMGAEKYMAWGMTKQASACASNPEDVSGSVHPLTPFPTYDDVVSKVEKVNEKASLRKRRLGSGAKRLRLDDEGEGDDDEVEGEEDEQGDGDCEVIDADEGCTKPQQDQAPMADDASKNDEPKTPKTPPPTQAQLRRSQSAAAEALSTSGGSKGIGGGNNEVAHAVGTTDYWIAMLPLEQTLDGVKQGKAEFQARSKLAKISGPEKRRLASHLALVETAKIFAAESVCKHSDEELLEGWAKLRQAKVALTMNAKLGLAKRRCARAWTAASSAETTEEKTKYIKELLKAARVWREEREDGQENLIEDVLSLSFGQATNDDAECAKCLEEAVYGNLAQWLEEGSSRKDDILLFSKTAEAEWGTIPLNASLGDASAQAHVNGLRSLRFLLSLQEETLTASSNASEMLEEIRFMESEKVRARGPTTISQVIAQGLDGASDGFWVRCMQEKSKLARALDSIGPDVAKALGAMEAGQKLGGKAARAEMLKGVAAQLPYWEARLGEPAMRDAKAQLLKGAVDGAKQALNQEGCKDGDQAEKDVVFNAYRQWIACLMEVANTFPCEEELVRLTAQIRGRLAKADEGVRVRALCEALQAWDGGEKATQDLKLAVTSLKGAALAPETLILIDKKLMEGVKMVFDRNTASQPSLATEPGIYDGVEVMAACTEGERSEYVVKMSALLKVLHYSQELQEKIIEANKSEAQEKDKNKDLEKMAQQLMRQVQRAEQLMAQGACEGMQPFYDGCEALVVDLVSKATEAYMEVAGTVVQACVAEVDAQVKELKSVFERDSGYSDFQAAAGVESFDALVMGCWAKFKATPTEAWLLKGEQLEASINLTNAKLSDFGMKGSMQEGALNEARSMVKKARCVRVSQEMLAAFTSEQLTRDVVGLMRRCKLLQSQLQKWKLGPQDIVAALRERFLAGLRMEMKK